MSFSEHDFSTRPSDWSSVWSKVDSTCSIKRSAILIKQEAREESYSVIERPLTPEHKPDSQLENWKRWLEIHKKQQEKLSNILQRPPQCLLMNMNFNNLHVNQQKQLIREASGYEFCDKQRGHPSFWITDGSVHSGSQKLGIYQPIQKRHDRSHLKTQINWCPSLAELEYVGIPKAIMEEKGLSGEQCLRPPKVNWDMSHYVSKKKEELKEKLDLFQEHTPQTEELVILGTKLTTIDETRVTNYEIAITAFEAICYNKISKSHNVSEMIEPSIGDLISVAIDDEIVDSNLKEWTIYFENSVTYGFYEKKLIIQNLSDCCLRYSWEYVLPAWVKSDLPLKQIRNRKTFYFNKNNAVILPKSTVKLRFYLESEQTGIYHEKWKLYLNNAPDKEEYVLVHLQAVIDERAEIEQDLEILDSYIESCTRYSIASKTVNEVLQRSRPERPILLPYDYMFFEEQIFLFNNQELFYESKYVSLLKAMYTKISEGPWDLSVQTLRKKLLEKTLHEDVTGTLNEFTAIVCHLMKPKLKFSFINEKRKSVYELLCCFIDKMEKEGNSLKCILKLPLKMSTSLNDENVLMKTSLNSKLSSTKESIISRRSDKRKSTTKTRFSVEKTSTKFEENSLLRQSLTTGDSSETLSYELEEKIKKQEYLEALYVKTYHHLCITVDNISAVIDSFDAQNKKSALLSLKTNIL